MSVGTRIPAVTARAVAESLARRWGMQNATLVGSLRRGRPDVGDIDFIAPMPTGNADPLYDAIAATMKAEGLFAEAAGAAKPIGWAIKGLKPHFRSCELMVRSQSLGEIPVQIGRYDDGPKGNRGWIEIIRTGPADFGQWFLGKWKARWDIPRERPGSDEGYLLDIQGRPVATPTEQSCFELMAMPFIPPAGREQRRH